MACVFIVFVGYAVRTNLHRAFATRFIRVSFPLVVTAKLYFRADYKRVVFRTIIVRYRGEYFTRVLECCRAIRARRRLVGVVARVRNGRFFFFFHRKYNAGRQFARVLLLGATFLYG